MTKTGLVLLLASRYPGLYKSQIEKSVDTFFNEITAALSRGDRVELRDFGAFSVKIRAARKGRNPRTGEQVLIEAKYKANFKTGRGLRIALNDKQTAS